MVVTTILEMKKIKCNICNKETWIFPKYKKDLENTNCDECMNIEIKELPYEIDAV